MTREQALNRDLVRVYLSEKAGPKRYLGLKTRDQVDALQKSYYKTSTVVWFQTAYTTAG
tara:strand:- start:357 stop:533 length:177 start_codon:yes stop_codon:yes gene_type:complete